MDKLGISMSLATHEELIRIYEKQKMLRELLARLGVSNRQMQQVMFEKIPDEQRSCRFCKTTLFMCALVCNKHKKMTCVEHHDHLCNSCTTKDYRYQYRFELDQLNNMCDELGKRTVNYNGWKEESDEMLEEEGKPKLERIEEFIDSAKQNKYPQTDQVHKLITIRHTAKSAIEKANQLLFKKVRTRTKTRCQRADTRTDTEGVRSLIEQMQAMDCNLTVIIDKLEKWMEQVEMWRNRAKDAIYREQEYSKEEIEKIIEEGDEYDIKLEEIDELRKVIQMKDWSDRARKVTTWKATPDMEKDIDFEYKLRYASSDILSLIRDSPRNPTDGTSKLVFELQQMLRDANTLEVIANNFCENPALDQLQSIWQSLRETDWFYEKYINMVRYEIIHVAKIKSMIDAAIPVLSEFDLKTQLQKIVNVEITLSKAAEISKAFETSKCLNGSEEHLGILDMISTMNAFTQRIAILFKPNNAYHNLFEILSERDDLTPLAEGQTIPLYFQGGAVHPSDEWHQMKEFESLDQIVHHQSSLREMQMRIFEKVKQANSARGLEACSCLGFNKSDDSESTLTCIMCDSEFHVRCCEWSPFLEKLPEGCFLCVRCLRGQRPVIDDVTTALNGTPSGCLETHLVRNLIQKTRGITQNLMEAANKRKSGESSDDICKIALFDWLSCEILNPNGLPKARELISEFYMEYLQKQSSAALELKNRPVRSKPSVSLFDPKITAKRKRPSVSHKETSKKSRKRQSQASPSEYYEDESEFKSCQARACLKPYGDSVNWVMCEAGCKNWFHVICLGFTLREINDMHEYRCSSCLDHADSPTSSVSTD